MLCGGAEGFVEVGAEAADEGGFEELVDADAFAAAFFEGGSANLPAMKVEGQAASGHFADPYGVKGAGNRFSATGHLYGAKSRFFGLCNPAKYAFTGSTYAGGYEFSLAVPLKKSDFIHPLTSRLGHQRRKLRIIGLQALRFILFHRRAGIPLDAAYAAAYGVIAGKIFAYNLFTYKHIAYLYYSS
jgi:hypothetical protein